jgi:hypothetical protein
MRHKSTIVTRSMFPSSNEHFYDLVDFLQSILFQPMHCTDTRKLRQTLFQYLRMISSWAGSNSRMRLNGR